MNIYEHPNVVFPPPRPEQEKREAFVMRLLLWFAAIMLSSAMGFCLWLLTK